MSLRVLLGVLGVLGVAPAMAASFKSPAGWVRRDVSVAGKPALQFLDPSPEGDSLIELYSYPRSNEFKLTEKKFLSDYQTRTGRAPVKQRAGDKDLLLFKAVPLHESAWDGGHADTEEGVLGASGGDFSAKGKLLRCRKKGAWKTYAWYRDVHDKKSDAALFARHFGRDEERVLEACLGASRLRDIKEKRAPDASVKEPGDQELDALAAALEAARRKPAREESLATRPAKDGGFFVLRYETPAGKQSAHFKDFLAFLASFQD